MDPSETTEESQQQQAGAPMRVAAVPAASFQVVFWIGPALMVLAEAIGSGELLLGPLAGARYGGTLLWVILFAVISKAFWNEAIGRVSLVTGQNFLEVCASGGPVVSWVPWSWFSVNLIKDFFLRGGILAIGGLICYEIFGDLPAWSVAVWDTGEAGGSVARASGVALIGMVMAGSGTVRYSAWAEERGMGLLGHVRSMGRRLNRHDRAPQSAEEIRRMQGWLRVNRGNIALTYLLGALVCVSTFTLGVAVLSPAGVELSGPGPALKLSLMMTDLWGPWARGFFRPNGTPIRTVTSVTWRS